jgi:Fibronectin type III domain
MRVNSVRPAGRQTRPVARGLLRLRWLSVIVAVVCVVGGLLVLLPASAAQAICINSTECAPSPGTPTQDAPSAIGNGTVTINWTDNMSTVDNTSYAVYDSTTSGGENTLGDPACTASGASATTCTLSNLTNFTTYYFVVAGVDDGAISPPSNEESATPYSVPGTPTQDPPSAVGNGSVTVNWTAPASNGGSPITGYAVYDSTTSGGENTTGTPACTASGASATSCTASSFSAGVYYFVVVAINVAGQSSPSNEGWATPYTSQVTSVQFLKSAKAAMVVVNGSGFGPSLPAPSYPLPSSGCAPNLTGSLYGDSFYFQDLTRSWTAGQGGPGGTGDCIGSVVTSWSVNQIVFGFGNAYNTNGWILKGGDSYSLSLYSTTSTGTASYAPAGVSLTPNSGSPKAAVTVSGRGFAAGETVTVGYSTGLTSPKTVTICKATANSSGTYSCNGDIPTSAKAGAQGDHTVTAKGNISKIQAKTTFDLT